MSVPKVFLRQLQNRTPYRQGVLLMYPLWLKHFVYTATPFEDIPLRF
jgi:hypothetical protein